MATKTTAKAVSYGPARPPLTTCITHLPPIQKRSVSHGTAHDLWKYFQERPLDAIFRPKSVALIG